MPGMIYLRNAARTARRLTPLALELKRRWDRLPPHERERHKQRARDALARAAQTARKADEARKRRARRR
jgi:hypothetical protein